MLFTFFRAANAIFAVVVAILVSSRFGETATGNLLTVVITSGVVALFEFLMVWAPKHFLWVRQLLDPRAIFADVWIQEKVRVFGSEGPQLETPNRFSVFFIKYDSSIDNYSVKGRAYTGSGVEHARWDSEDVVHFSKDGRSMTYEFSGTIMTEALGAEDPRRKGFAILELSSDNAGSGRVDHVAVNAILIFDFVRITVEWLAKHNFGQYKPDSLLDPAARDQFAAAYAKTLGHPSAGASAAHG